MTGYWKYLRMSDISININIPMATTQTRDQNSLARGLRARTRDGTPCIDVLSAKLLTASLTVFLAMADDDIDGDDDDDADVEDDSDRWRCCCLRRRRRQRRNRGRAYKCFIAPRW